MPLEIRTVPCRSDNYAYIARESSTNATALFDAPSAGPILDDLAETGWNLDTIFLTHHHPDHVDGVDAIRSRTGARVIGAEADRHRLPALDESVSPGGPVRIGGETGVVLDVPGHTVGHVAFHFPGARAAFTGDSLMALGCGRVFEGTMVQMWESLHRLKSTLTPDTLIYSGHEYTSSNARFAVTIEPENPDLLSRREAVEEARRGGAPTVPATLETELATNPFLRADRPEVKKLLGLEDAADAEVFAEIRRRKDEF